MNFSQICFAHIEKDEDGRNVFVDVYADEIATKMFDAGEIFQVIVTESDSGCYWAWKKYNDKNIFYHIWKQRWKTEECISQYNNYEGELVQVDIKRWSKI